MSKTMNEAQMQKITQNTADALKKQKKVKVKLYLPAEERRKLEANKKLPWPFETVQINGHTFQIQRGKEVEVPEAVAKVLSRANLI